MELKEKKKRLYGSENFNQFGPTFQSKIISSLLSDNKFIQTISDILESAYFDSGKNQMVIKRNK